MPKHGTLLYYELYGRHSSVVYMIKDIEGLLNEMRNLLTSIAIGIFGLLSGSNKYLFTGVILITVIFAVIRCRYELQRKMTPMVLHFPELYRSLFLCYDLYDEITTAIANPEDPSETLIKSFEDRIDRIINQSKIKEYMKR